MLKIMTREGFVERLVSISVSLFVDWLSLSNAESEANPNNNLMMMSILTPQFDKKNFFTSSLIFKLEGEKPPNIWLQVSLVCQVSVRSYMGGMGGLGGGNTFTLKIQAPKSKNGQRNYDHILPFLKVIFSALT